MAANMHVRDIPDEVKEKLARLAEREHMSLNAYVVRQLEMASRTADNARLLDGLASYDISTGDVVHALAQEREGR
jgi:plasmid stability protein